MHHHNAESAINHSVASKEIVTINVPSLDCERALELCDDLNLECDTNVLYENWGRPIHEFWGANDDGEWRVHVLAAE